MTPALVQHLLWAISHGYHVWAEYHPYGGGWRGGWVEWLATKP